MKIFLDSANLEEIKLAVALGVIDGVTTNPSLIAKEGIPVHDQIRSICSLVDGDVSAEVTSVTAAEMIAEGRSLARIHKNVVVKIPMIPEGIMAVAALAREGIRTNVTLVFSAAQALLAAKAGAYIVSPFVGRLDDMGTPGMQLIADIVTIYRNYSYPTQVLAASVRGTLQVIEVAKAGSHITTLPYKVLEMIFQHPLTNKGLESFLEDYRRVFQFTTA